MIKHMNQISTAKKAFSCFAGILLAAGLSTPVAGTQIVPSSFAPAFCAARRSGMTISKASEFAIQLSADELKPPAPKINGISVDVKLAVQTAYFLCPASFGADASISGY
ncbi:hypothetical protein UFOVP431_48 [uncultured Caudovirales phage]|uniref:Uncharacterized protein n=1 Tax=uncultured Caudovirales phage TaxID=2100421 RepID=A0A6J5MRU3_9CAUD|nr:hypothetical protein UFOVP431_48 [uncultured Caudovirales phage]